MAEDTSTDSWSSWVKNMILGGGETEELSTEDSPAGDTSTQGPDTEEASKDVVAGVGDGGLSHVDSDSRQALWAQLASLVGMDVMNYRLSLPIFLFEPSTSLTRMLETFEYWQLLDQAAGTESPVLRNAFVAAFVISAFAHTERVRKPFNPVLGETFSWTSEDGTAKFFAEQVSHHPPISASYVRGTDWCAGEVVDIKATFLGNSIEIDNVGRRMVTLTRFDEKYTWTLPKSAVGNLFVGGAFVDHFGEITITNHASRIRSHLNLSRCGWFGSGRYQVSGKMTDEKGELLMEFGGSWNKQLYARAEGEEQETLLWEAGDHIPDEERFGFTLLGLEILDLEITDDLPLSDSRRRGDLRALKDRNLTLAGSEKLRIEQLQRQRRSVNSEEDHVPLWFTRAGEGRLDWDFVGEQSLPDVSGHPDLFN